MIIFNRLIIEEYFGYFELVEYRFTEIHADYVIYSNFSGYVLVQASFTMHLSVKKFSCIA